MIIEIENLKRISNKIAEREKTVLFFYSPECTHCKVMGVYIKKVNDIVKEKILFCKINMKELQKAVEEFDLKAVPTLILYQNGTTVLVKQGGEENNRLVGEISADKFKKLIQYYLQL